MSSAGYHLAWVIGAGLLITALAAAVAVLRRAPAAVPTEAGPVVPVDDERAEIAQAA